MTKILTCTVLLALTLWFPHSGFAQIKTSVSFSNPWVNQAKQVNEDRKEYKKYLNDSLKSFKKLDKYYKNKLDSMTNALSSEVQQRTNISPGDVARLKRLKKEHKVYKHKYDSLNALPKPLGAESTKLEQIYQHKIDSVKSGIFELTQKYGTNTLEPYGQYTPTTLDSLLAEQQRLPNLATDSVQYYLSGSDSLSAEQAGLLMQRQQLLQKQAEDYLESYAESIGGVDQIQLEQQRMLAEQKRLDAYKANFNRYRDKKNLKSSLQNLSKSDLLKKNETINDAHKTLATYKKKYLTLPSSKHLESGTKLNSLEGKSFWERIKVGGNLRINQQQYLNIDFAPSIAYLINKKWSVGTEFVYRGEFGNGNKWYNSFQSNTYGGRIFTDYTVYKSFFAHAEFENLYTQTGNQQTELKTTQSVPGAMAGIGKTFGIGKNVDGKVLIQYNFIYDESKQLYTSPWVVRFGFDIKKLKKTEL